jgi:hypothetical protein
MEIEYSYYTVNVFYLNRFTDFLNPDPQVTNIFGYIKRKGDEEKWKPT